MNRDAPREITEGSLDPLNPQSPCATDVLKIFQQFRAHLERHYRMFKATLADSIDIPAEIRNQTKNRTSKNVPNRRSIKPGGGVRQRKRQTAALTSCPAGDGWTVNLVAAIAGVNRLTPPLRLRVH
jgi:hypothetical protein